MHKIIHLTDTHIVAPGEFLFQIDPSKRLRQVLANAEATYPEVETILITGDLTHTGAIAEYETLHDILQESTLPIRLMLGNHDNRANFRAVFGGCGFVQDILKLGDWHIIMLDSHDEDIQKGSLDGGRIEWLEERLSEASDKSVLIGMHHPPHRLHMPNFAKNGLCDAQRFLDVISKYDNIRHMLFGHIHVGVSGSIGRIPFSVNRGSAQHIALDLTQQGKPTFVAGAPVYDLVILDDDSVTVHRHEGLETLSVIRPADPK